MTRFVRTLVMLLAVTAATGSFAQTASSRAKPDPRPVLKALSQSLSSENPQPWIEWEQRLNAEQRLTAYGPDLLGDQIDPATGAISFEHTDVSLPGNSRLEVSLRRRLTQGYLYGEGVNAEFGNWEHLVPRIVAISRSTGWTGARCDNSYNTSFPVIPQVGTYPVQYLYHGDYSNGVKLEVPGQGSQQVLESPQGGQWPASRRYTTTENWYFTCITASDGGQGFMGHAPNGDKYRFDRYINHAYRPLGVLMSSRSTGTPRSKSILAATEVTDVNGNWVRYTYDGAGRLTRIHANDGREITLAYSGSSRLVATVTANPATQPRTWSYSYRATAGGKPFWEGGGPINIQQLATVTQPDGRAWIFTLDDMFQEPTPGECASYPSPLVVKHPYGVTGTFQLVEARHRKGLHWVMEQLFDCPNGEPSPPGPANPAWVTAQIDTISVHSKQLSGPGMATATWTFQYEFDGGPPGSSSGDPTNTTVVQQPDDSEIHYKHLWQEGALGGKLVHKEIRQRSIGVTLERSEYTYVAEGRPGYTFAEYGSPALGAFMKQRPLMTRIHRGNDWYRTDYAYDTDFFSPGYSFGHPTRVTETSSTVPSTPNPNDSARIAVTTYLHDKALWVIGLPTSVVRNGKLFDAYTYDGLRRVQTHSRFGTPKATFTYHGTAGQQGMVAGYTDGLGHAYALNHWKRGKPQSVSRPDGTSFSRVVDDNGWVVQETDGRNITTNFAYNPVGWLTKVDRHYGFNDTDTLYAIDGHGVHATSTRGTQRTTLTYDAMLRPRLVRRDATDGSVTPIFERSAFDAFGRETFKSWPSFAATPTTGVETTFDALGRVVRSKENVPPHAETITTYLGGARTEVRDPAQAVTVTVQRAFGTPEKPEVMSVQDPLNTVTQTSRDIFGNVTQLTQSGNHNGYSVGVTRQFWYDSSLRLCRHRAPEFGDELFSYDEMDRLRFSSRGEAAGTGCAEPSSSIRTRLYHDARGRLYYTEFPASTPSIAVTYDGNGNKTSVSRGGVVWTYGYNALDQLSRETLSIDGRTYDFVHGYNANGQLRSRERVGTFIANLAPDALGRHTGLSVGGAGYIHSVLYHPNGLVNVGRFGNGHEFVQTLTARQRPLELTTRRPGGPTVMQRSHDYDTRNKVKWITDAADPAANRIFDYDAKGRVSIINGPWGSGSVVYDALDNIRRQTLGGRVIDVSYADGSNRVTSASDAGQFRPYGYDARGNATTVGALGFGYDFANQPVSMWGAASASHVYDGNLKRVKSVAGGKTVYTVYSALGGSVMLRHEVTDGREIDFLAVGPLSVRLTNGATPEYIHADHLGSPVAATNASGGIVWRENYTPFGEARMRPAGNADQPGFTGHVQDSATGLTYMQARYYDPVVGRFLATDPIGYEDQLNLYAYVGNDPINSTDPDGKSLAHAAAFVLGFGIDVAAQMLVDKKSFNDVNFRDAALSGLGAAITGGIGGKLATAAMQGAIKTETAIAGTAAAGAITGAIGSAASSISQGQTPDPAKMAVNAIGSAAGAGVGAKLANSAAAKLATDASRPGIAGHVGTTTLAAAQQGGKAVVRTSVGQEVGKAGADAAAAVATKRAEKELTK